MTERERLEGMLLKMPICEFVRYDEASRDTVYDIKKLADYLLANGVIVSPCNVGDAVYYVECEMICKGKIDRIEYNLYTDPHLWIEVEYRSPIVGTQITRGRVDLFWNKVVFLTREEAEEALKERVW